MCRFTCHLLLYHDNIMTISPVPTDRLMPDIPPSPILTRPCGITCGKSPKVLGNTSGSPPRATSGARRKFVKRAPCSAVPAHQNDALIAGFAHVLMEPPPESCRRFAGRREVTMSPEPARTCNTPRRSRSPHNTSLLNSFPRK